MKKVIYTSLTGNYDSLMQPLASDPSVHYVCFTDREGQDGVWQLRKIPFGSGSDALRSRYPKMHPHLLLPGYDLSLYMDANLCIRGAGFYDFLHAPEGGMALVEHPDRDCVYDELRYCYLKGKLGTRAAIGLMKKYRDEGMPQHFGLYEANMILREHNRPDIIAFDERWWNMLLGSGCVRDQLSLTPALFAEGIRPSLLLGEGLTSRNVPYLHYENHPPTGKENVPGKLNMANLKYNIRLLWRKTVLLCLR